MEYKGNHSNFGSPHEIDKIRQIKQVFAIFVWLWAVAVLIVYLFLLKNKKKKILIYKN
jgi:hypothetical protein